MTGTSVIWSVKWVTSVIWSVKSWVMHSSWVWGIETGVYNVAWCSNRCRIRLSCILQQPELLCSVTSSFPWPPLCFLQFCKLTTTAPQVDNLQQRQPSLSSGAIMLLYLAFSVAVLDSCLPRVVLSITREYYIAAMVREWNYAPTGLNLIKGIPLNDSR